MNRTRAHVLTRFAGRPPEVTAAEIGRIYLRAFELGLKGITVYRYTSRPSQVLELGSGEEPYQREHAAKCDPNECQF